MIDRQSLLAQLLMGPPQPTTRLSQLTRGDAIDTMRQSLPPMATPDTRAGRPNRLVQLTMPSPEFEPAVRPFGSPHVPAVTTPSEERRLVELAMMLGNFAGPIRAYHGTMALAPRITVDRASNQAERAAFFTNHPREAQRFGPNVYRAALDDSAVGVYRWRDYSPDPIYDPSVMERILAEARKAGHKVAEVRGVQNFEYGPRSITYAVLDDAAITGIRPVVESGAR